jgi:hypothetical protein
MWFVTHPPTVFKRTRRRHVGAGHGITHGLPQSRGNVPNRSRRRFGWKWSSRGSSQRPGVWLPRTWIKPFTIKAAAGGGGGRQGGETPVSLPGVDLCRWPIGPWPKVWRGRSMLPFIWRWPEVLSRARSSTTISLIWLPLARRLVLGQDLWWKHGMCREKNIITCVLMAAVRALLRQPHRGDLELTETWGWSMMWLHIWFYLSVTMFPLSMWAPCPRSDDGVFSLTAARRKGANLSSAANMNMNMEAMAARINLGRME